MSKQAQVVLECYSVFSSDRLLKILTQPLLLSLLSFLTIFISLKVTLCFCLSIYLPACVCVVCALASSDDTHPFHSYIMLSEPSRTPVCGWSGWLACSLGMCAICKSKHANDLHTCATMYPCGGMRHVFVFACESTAMCTCVHVCCNPRISSAIGIEQKSALHI